MNLCTFPVFIFERKQQTHSQLTCESIKYVFVQSEVPFLFDVFHFDHLFIFVYCHKPRMIYFCVLLSPKIHPALCVNVIIDRNACFVPFS